MTIMATSAYLSAAQGPPSAGTVTSEHEDSGVMNLVNTSNSQGYSLPREQVVRLHTCRWKKNAVLKNLNYAGFELTRPSICLWYKNVVFKMDGLGQLCQKHPKMQVVTRVFRALKVSTLSKMIIWLLRDFKDS